MPRTQNSMPPIATTRSSIVTAFFRRVAGSLSILIAIGVIGVIGAQPAIANSPKKPLQYHSKPTIPKIGDEEYHARQKSIALPGHRKGKSAGRGYQQIFLNLVLIAGSEDDMVEICTKSLLFRDVMLTEFHRMPIALDKRGGISDKAATMSRISGLAEKAFGNELVTGIRLASENVAEYAEVSTPCRY